MSGTAMRLRFWLALEGGVVGAVIALAALGMRNPGGDMHLYWAWGGAIFLILAICLWVLVNLKPSPMVIPIFLYLPALCSAQVVLLLLSGAPLFELLLVGSLGLALGILAFFLVEYLSTVFKLIFLTAGILFYGYSLLGNPTLVPDFSSALASAGFVSFGLIASSLFQRGFNTGRLSRNFAGLVWIVWIWVGPVLNLLRDPGGDWKATNVNVLWGVLGSLALAFLGAVYENSFGEMLWVIPWMVKKIAAFGEQALTEEQYLQARRQLAHAHWLQPSDLNIQFSLAYACLKSGKEHTAQEFAREQQAWLVEKFTRYDEKERWRAFYLLDAIGATSSVGLDELGVDGLLNAAVNKDKNIQEIARKAIRSMQPVELERFASGMDHPRIEVRRLIVNEYLDHEMANELARHLGPRLKSSPTRAIVEIIAALLTSDPGTWRAAKAALSQGEGIHSLDLLAEAMLLPNKKRVTAARAWSLLESILHDRLLTGCWEKDLALARRCAQLSLALGPAFMNSLTRALIGESPSLRALAARRLTRLGLLTASPAELTSKQVEIHPQFGATIILKGKPHDSYPLPVLVATTPEGEETVLLVNGEEYALNIRLEDPHEVTHRLEFIVQTDEVPVQPFRQVIQTQGKSPQIIQFQVQPNSVTPDRMTVKLLARNRIAAWLDLRVYACHADVFQGLKS
jgi:hypothetical protein